MKGAHIRIAVSLALVSSSVGCDFGVPEQPDLSAVIARYEAPTGTVDADSARRVAEFLESTQVRLGTLQDAEQLEEIFVTVGELDEDPSTGEIDVGGVPLEGSGGIRYRGRCGGYGDGAAESGALSVVISVRDTAIERVIQTGYDACRFLDEVDGVPVEVEVDGALDVDLGGRLRIGDLPAGRTLTFRFVGRIALQGDALDVAADLRWRLPDDQADPPVTEQTLAAIDTPDGVVLWFLEADGTTGILARDGVWICDFQEAVCLRDDQPDERVDF